MRAPRWMAGGTGATAQPGKAVQTVV